MGSDKKEHKSKKHKHHDKEAKRKMRAETVVQRVGNRRLRESIAATESERMLIRGIITFGIAVGVAVLGYVGFKLLQHKPAPKPLTACATVFEMEGEVSVYRAGAKMEIAVKGELLPGDRLVIGNGTLLMEYKDMTSIRLYQTSDVMIARIVGGRRLNVELGAVHVTIPETVANNLTVSSQYGTYDAVTGRFTVDVGRGRARIEVNQGTVEAASLYRRSRAFTVSSESSAEIGPEAKYLGIDEPLDSGEIDAPSLMVTQFALMDAEKDFRVLNMDPLPDGAVVPGVVLGIPLDVRIDVEGKAKAVRLVLRTEGKVIRERLSTETTFCLFGGGMSNEKERFDYHGEVLQPGDYILEATPYLSMDGKSGKGRTKMIRLRVPKAE